MSTPPQGRPPVPPLDKAPPAQGDPHPPTPHCEQASNMPAEQFWEGVKATIRRELVRHCIEQKNPKCLDGDIDAHAPTPMGEAMVDALVAAFKEGKTVPGLSAHQDGNGVCTMNWQALACFARWYTSEFVTGEMREAILAELKLGASAAELMADEVFGVNWYDCDGTEPDEEKKYCCPASIFDDWYYQQLTEGRVPQKKEEGIPWLGVALLGIGVFAVAVTLRVVSQQHTSNPSASTIPVPSAGKTRQQRHVLRARALRADAAVRHSFEEWDELREHVGRPVPAYLSGASEDLHALVRDLRSIGARTSEKNEVEWMLNLSAGVS